MSQSHTEQEQSLLNALRQAEENYRALFRTNPHPMWIYDTQTLAFLAVNDAAVERYGYSEQEFLQMTIKDIRPPEDVPPLLAVIAQTGEGVYHSGLWRHRKKDGTMMQVEMTSHGLEFAGRKARLAQAIDVTERLRAEAALRESEAKYRQLVDLMPAAVYACDCDGKITFYNERALELWGCRPLPGEAGIEHCGCRRALAAERRAVPPEELPLALACRRGQSSRNVEGIVQRADGSRAHVLVNLDPLRDPAGQVVGAIVVLTDITERKRTRTALQNQNRRLALLSEAAALLLSADEPDRALLGIYERIAGSFQTSGVFEFEVGDSGDELHLKFCIGVGEPSQNCRTPPLRIGEGIVGTVAHQRQSVVLGRVHQSEDPNVQILKQIGVGAYACFPLLVGGRLLGALSFASEQRETFEPEDLEFFQTLAGYLALARERLRLRHELQQHAASLERTVDERTSKLCELVAELEHMSYSIVHDMRAPLRAIQGYAGIIAQREHPRLSPDSRDLFERMVASTNRMDQLITDVLNYNRAVREELPLKPVDLGRVLRDLLRTYPNLQAARAEVRLEGEFPPVLGNEGWLTQCFSNLLSNAVKFVSTGSTARVRVWPELRAASGTVRVWVEDQGTGIPREGRERIFQMFQRMHGPEYEGTGVGLALVRKLMDRMGGRVGVESEPGQGSRFWVELKAASQSPAG